MRTMGTAIVALVLAAGMTAGVASAAAPQAGEQRAQAQRGRGQGAPPAPAAGLAVQELQQMFDAYALVQAQRMLLLSDEQYQRFFTRMTRLHELRRQHARQRTRLIADLRRMAGPSGRNDDAALTAALEALDAAEQRFQDDLRAARLAVDEALTVRQRAAFRFFEEEMDRQKIDFLMRARQSGRE